VQSSPNKGYRLDFIPDKLRPSDIITGLGAGIIGSAVKCFDVLDSTNTFAKSAAAQGCSEGTVILAETQTAGRGRLGREWSSKEGAGIWMSVVLRPYISPEHVQLITLAASVAVAKGIKNVTGIQAGIKWPNDIILNGRKLCGILTEMACELDRINYVVVGIGLNVNQKSQDFSGELSDKAISLNIYSREKTFYNRVELIKSILLELDRMYICVNERNNQQIIREWKELSVTLGKEVRILSKDSQFTGKAADVTEEGKLVVIDGKGESKEILSGEISVRGIMGYTGGN
jgi:BirA family biotin operon repressor/biotin-[acetyl-CoA-carboxylase] ligase